MIVSYKSHIDGLRAIAVMSVLLYHLDLPYITGGFVGVDVFFVISGYLITGNIVRSLQSGSGFSFSDFYYRRAKRIFPALAATLAACLVFSVALLVPAKFKLFGGALAAASASVSNVFLYFQAGYFDIFSQSNPLLHTWSLGVEEQFYVFWPVILLIVFGISKKKWAIPSAVAAVGALSFYLNLAYQNQDLTGLYYLVQFRAFELCIGAAILWLPSLDKKSPPTVADALFLSGLLLVIYPFFAYDENTLFPSYNALMPAVGAALVIYAGGNSLAGRILSLRPMVFIGLISYSLYLAHWPLIVFMKSFNENIGLEYSLSGWQQIIAGVSSVAIGFLMYRFVEQPTRKKSIADTKGKRIYIAKWVAIFIVMLGIGLSIFKSDGWLWRVNIPMPIQSAEEITEFHLKNWGGAGFQGGLLNQGASSYPSIVMMGDSHSGMLDTGVINKIAKPYDLTVFSSSGGGGGKYISAFLLPGTTKVGTPQEMFDEHSQKAAAEVIGKISESEKSILLYSASYADQIMRSAANIDDHQPWSIVPGKNGDNFDVYQPLIDALERMRLAIDGRKFVLVGNFPGSSKYQVIRCVAQLKWFPSSLCLPEQPRGDNPAALEVNRALKAFADQHENVIFIDPYDVFCDDEFCQNADANGNPFYSDTAHLSKIGSDFFAEKIKDRILEAVGIR